MIVHAHIVCAAATAGGLDCAVVVDRDRAAVWQAAYSGHVTISSELPFGATPEVTLDLAPESPEGARWIAPYAFAAYDFRPCAVTTVRAELDGDGVVWRGSLELPRKGCAHPRVQVHPRCDRAYVMFQGPSYDGYNPEPQLERTTIECTLGLDAAREREMHELARLDGAIATEAGGLQLPDLDDRRCRRARVELALTTSDGAVVWRGSSPIDCTGNVRIVESY
jgi:hypothetical protein